MGGGLRGPPYYLILNNSKVLVARFLKLFHFLEYSIWRFSAKFQGHRSIRSKNIKILGKLGRMKSGKSYIFPIYFEKEEIVHKMSYSDGNNTKFGQYT